MSRRGRKKKNEALRYYLEKRSSDDGPIASAKELINGSWEKQGHGPVVVVKEEPVSTWTTGESAMSKCASACSWAEQNKSPETKILLNQRVGNAVRYLLDNAPGEWQMLLLGQVEPSGSVLVLDYYIAKQVVGAAHVRNLDCIDRQFIESRRVVATLHSHVNMQARFSSTDWESCNSSPIKYHVVINKRFEYEAVKQVQLACGMFKFEHVKLEFDMPILEKPDGFENITEETYARGAHWESSWSVEEPLKLRKASSRSLDKEDFYELRD